MRPILLSIPSAHTPESLTEQLAGERGVVLLRSSYFDSPQARYSFVAARPLLIFRCFGVRCELDEAGGRRFGNPWQALEQLMGRFELRDQIDLPFPLSACFLYSKGAAIEGQNVGLGSNLSSNGKLRSGLFRLAALTKCPHHPVGY